MLLKAEGLYVFGPYRLDSRERQLLRDGARVPLPPKAFDLLLALVSRAGSLATKEELLSEVWPGTFVEEVNLSYTVSLLRKALGDVIETVPKSGYRFIAPVSIETATAEYLSSTNRTHRRVKLRWLAALIVLGLVGGSGWIVWRARLGHPPEPITTPITSFGGLSYGPRLSPDGKYVIYQWDGRRNEGDPVNWDIYVQSVDSTEPSRLTSDSQSEFGAAWSPDGSRIAFLFAVTPERYRIRVIPRSGGTPHTVSPPDVFAAGDGVDWSPDGQSIAFTMVPDGPGGRPLALVSPDTGQVRQLTMPDAGFADRSPRFSPDGRTIAFLRVAPGGGTPGEIYTTAVTGAAARQMTSGGSGIQGHDWTADGKELVFSSNRSGQRTLWRIAADKPGSEPQPVPGIGTDAFSPTIARKGNRLAYSEQRADSDIWRVPISLGDAGSQPGVGASFVVQNSTRMDLSPQVSRDGARLVFVSRRSGDQAIWVSDIDGQNPLQIAAFPGHPAGAPRWSPTGTRVAFDASRFGHSDIFIVGAQGVPPPLRLTTEPPENIVPSWSRDEKWIYFASNRSGRYEVWKVTVDAGGTPTQVTRGGGFAPVESRDGKFVYYLKAIDSGQIWRARVEGGEETFVVEGPTARFWGYWTLLENGICFATQQPYRRATALVQYFDFVTKGTAILGNLDTQAIAFGPWFAMTPDRKSILYVKNKPTTSDIILVKNFR
jgi:Tol biopolymer transport system component/DNA-binding winged helix-turn-helix (wHTH) protein